MPIYSVIARVSDNAQVSEKARIYGNVRVFGHASVYGNVQVSGKAKVSRRAQIYGNAQVSGNARVHGDTWKKSPLSIQGTRDTLTTSSHTEITIGCETFTVEEWLKRYEEIVKKYKYSEEEIEEYFSHLKYMSKYMEKLKGNGS